MKCPFTTNTSNKQCASFCSLILGYHIWCACVCVCVCVSVCCCVYVCACVNGLRVCDFYVHHFVALLCLRFLVHNMIYNCAGKIFLFFFLTLVCLEPQGGAVNTPSRNSGGGVTPFNPSPRVTPICFMIIDQCVCLLFIHTDLCTVRKDCFHDTQITVFLSL